VKNIDEKISGIGGVSAAVPSEKRSVRGGGCAALLKKRLSIFGGRKRERPVVSGVVTAFAGGVRGFV
jgi:hypothetical protein